MLLRQKNEDGHSVSACLDAPATENSYSHRFLGGVDITRSSAAQKHSTDRPPNVQLPTNTYLHGGRASVKGGGQSHIDVTLFENKIGLLQGYIIFSCKCGAVKAKEV